MQKLPHSCLTHEPDFQLNIKAPQSDYLHRLSFDRVASRIRVPTDSWRPFDMAELDPSSG